MARDHVSVRLSPAGLKKVDELVETSQTNRSAVIRALLAEALATDSIVMATRARLKLVSE